MIHTHPGTGAQTRLSPSPAGTQSTNAFSEASTIRRPRADCSSTAAQGAPPCKFPPVDDARRRRDRTTGLPDPADGATLCLRSHDGREPLEGRIAPLRGGVEAEVAGSRSSPKDHPRRRRAAAADLEAAADDRPGSTGSRPMPASASSAAVSRLPGPPTRSTTGPVTLTPEMRSPRLMDGRRSWTSRRAFTPPRRVMSAYRIEVGLHRTMRDRLRPTGSPRDHLLEAAHVRADRRAAGSPCSPSSSSAIPIQRVSRAGGRDAPSRRIRPGNRLLARPRRCAATISPTAAAQGRYWLVGDVRNTPGRSMFVRLEGPPAGRRRQMDRRRDRRAWRPARRDPRSCGLVDFRDVADEARRFLAMPRSEPNPPTKPHRPRPPVRPKPRDASSPCRSRSRHARGDIFARTRHYRFARNRQPAIPSALLLSPRRACADRDLAGDDRRRHRPRRHPHRRAPHLARPGRRRQGAGRHAAAGHGRSPRQCASASASRSDVMAAGEGIETMLSLRCVLPPCRWRRRSRPTISPPSCSRRRCAGSTSLATTIRPVMGRVDTPDRARRRGRHRGHRAVARLGDFNEDLRALGIDCARAAAARSARAGGRRPLHGARGMTDGGHRGGTRRRGRSRARCLRRRRGAAPRPSRGRSARRRPGPAMAAAGYFPLRRRAAPPFHREAK